MPSYLYKRLLEIIKELISDLQNNSLPHWIVIDKVSIEMILVYLEDWYVFIIFVLLYVLVIVIVI